MGLFVAGLESIKISFRVWKTIEQSEKHYRVEASATCVDRDDGILLQGRDPLHASVSVNWYIPEDEDDQDMNDMEWKALLRLLRRGAKRSFNQYGERRSREEEDEIDRELVTRFYMGDRARVAGEY